MKPSLFWLIVFCGCFFREADAQDVDPNTELNQLLAEDEAFQKQEFSSPVLPFPDVSPAAEQRRALFYKNEQERLSSIDKSRLTAEGRINYELLKYILEDRIAQQAFEAYLVPLNAEGGWYTDFILSVDNEPFATEADYKKYIEKLRAFKAYAGQNIALMREGLQKGRTAPQAILLGRENVVDACIVETAEDSPFYLPFANMPPSISAEKQTALRAEGKRAILESVVPAYLVFRDFWQNEYIPGAAKEIGIASQPGGKEYYEQRIRHYTTLPMTADQVFERGLMEVARIRKEMEGVIKAAGFKGTFPEFLAFLRTDARFYAKSGEELLKEASFICKKIDGKLPRYFGRLPRNPYGVSPVPAAIAPTYTTGRYSEGAPEKHRAGSYWVNTYNLPARPLYVLPSLTLHEAVPGHHLQISLAQEMEGVAEFRKNFYISAFGEGWALYCEWLGEEMGLYETPYERFGKLTYEMWRAVRLVVDPGLHVKGWPRQQAIDFMAANTALSLHECTTEIDRYIGWPGQAVSYKTGELKIRELRQRAEEALGEKFDLRDFHDLVLSEGSVPLFVLENMVEEWIEARKKD
ncbi:MAG: DUF885 domain-containing protein [Saprospiraceae bacterium]